MAFDCTRNRKRSRKRRHNTDLDCAHSPKNGNGSPSTPHGDDDLSGGTGPDGRSLTVAEFCSRHKISKSTFYDLRGKGLGPQEMRIGRIIRISSASDHEWVAKMEAGTAAFVPQFEPKHLMLRTNSHDEETARRNSRRGQTERDRVATSESLGPERRRKRNKTLPRRKKQRPEGYFAMSAGPDYEGLDVGVTIPHPRKQSEKRQRCRSKRRNREA